MDFSLFCMRFSSWWYHLILGRLSWIASGGCSTSAVLRLSDWRRHFTQGGWFSELLNYSLSVCTRLIDWLIDWLTAVDWLIDCSRLIDWSTISCHRFRSSRKICTRWSKLTKENHWNYMFTIRTRIHVGKWRLCRTVTGAEKEGMFDCSFDWLIDSINDPDVVFALIKSWFFPHSSQFGLRYWFRLSPSNSVPFIEKGRSIAGEWGNSSQDVLRTRSWTQWPLAWSSRPLKRSWPFAREARASQSCPAAGAACPWRRMQPRTRSATERAGTRPRSWL